jgi:hypothetical protein
MIWAGPAEHNVGRGEMHGNSDGNLKRKIIYRKILNK